MRKRKYYLYLTAEERRYIFNALLTFRNKLIEAYNQIHNVDHGRTVILCNRKVQTYLAIMATNAKNVDLRFDEFAGKKVTHFWTSPILMNDAILGTESQLV